MFSPHLCPLLQQSWNILTNPDLGLLIAALTGQMLLRNKGMRTHLYLILNMQYRQEKEARWMLLVDRSSRVNMLS